MLFARLAFIIAVLMLVFGTMRVLMGFHVASIEPREAREAATARYIGGKSSGEAIDQGFNTILIAVALGTLAGIARRIPK